MKHFLVLKILVTLFVLFASRLEGAMQAPQIRCLSLDSLGNAVITWEIPPDPGGEFQQYQIYYRNDFTSPFLLKAQVSSQVQDSLVLSGNFCNEGSFYMATVFDEGGGADTSAASTIVSPMRINLLAVGESVEVLWNVSGLPSTDSVYRVYHRFQGGNWILGGTTVHPVTSYVDSVDVCNDTLEYKVEVTGIGGCISRSCQDKVFVMDEEAPEITNIVASSVDTATGHVVLQWAKSASPDVYGYLLTYFSEFKWRDTIFGGSDTVAVYHTNAINAGIRPETISVAPFDSCFNEATGWYNQAADNLRFQTLFLQVEDADVCEGTISLKWNKPRTGHPTGVEKIDRYRLLVRKGNAPMSLVATISSEDSTYLHKGLESGHTYAYVLEAVNDSLQVQANSNKAVFGLVPPKQPQYIYISSIRNNFDPGQNEVKLAVDAGAEVDNYALYRSLTAEGPFQMVVRNNDTADSIVTILDESGMAGQSAFYYQVAAVDVCGDEVAFSNIARSMHITGAKEEIELKIHLEWNPYEGWADNGSAVENYRLVRVLNNEADGDALRESADFFNYTDNLNNLLNIGGEICYYIEASQSTADSFGFNETSVSNMACFKEEPLIFMPNAFSPDGDNINDVFLPVVNYVDPFNYELIIWNRRGQMVFRSTDPAIGWNGQNAPVDVYAYQVFMRNVRDEVVEVHGKVALIR